jgi:PDZ domain
VLHRLCLLLAALAVLVPLRAQDEPIHMRPEFPLIFPLTQNGNDVTVQYPVMINPVTVIKPGMVLRTIYILSADAQDANDHPFAKKGSLEDAYARRPPGDNSGATPLPPGVATEINNYHRTVWQVPNNFVLAMAQYPTDAMHLVYAQAGQGLGKDLLDERFSFFDGLFVGLPNGKVTVIAVEKESKTESAGLKAGDVILSVGGNPTKDDLQTFALAYSRAKKAAAENEVPTYTMTILSEGSPNPRQVNISMPPTIKSGLMDGFGSP